MNKTIITVILVLVVGAGGFYAGMKYQQNQRGNLANRQFGNNVAGARTGTNGMMRQGFRPVNGDILNADDKSITVKLTDGSSKIVLLTDKTEVSKAAAATKTDLTTGTKVAVFGTENSDGSVTATTIQLNPMIRANSSPSSSQVPAL
jgi:hypothetical protein